ncbi:helix-turn-helix domain-containing protein [Pelosinus sp. UFO1]|uniref:helix-turn-helix domain-containing protein n=1 Tax=Pelosinus sp. UFO1 TaxID=484770 RepID=UPI0004D0E9D6|nr:helix-turn-helix transcriptional regulator [Pelosinus sp. UFO1]AIF53685.1 transcriptional regulator, XRE family [Pelosinus sp. UFO1]
MKNLVNFRKAKGWSQKELSDKAGVSQTFISELEAGKKQPTVLIAQKLATALGITLSELLNEEFGSPKSKAS